jgi:hypothetical protein
LSAQQEPEPPTPSSLSPVLAVLMIAIPAAVILGFWLNARLIHGWGPLIATWAYAIFATIFVWLDRRSSRNLAAGPPIDEVTMRGFLIRAAVQAALSTPLTGTAILLILKASSEIGTVGFLLLLVRVPGLMLIIAVMFTVGLVGCARARRRVMVSPSPRRE